MIVLELAGEFDLAQADRLNDALAVAADAEDVVLDFSNVCYMDSTVLNALVAFRRMRAERGRRERVVIEGPSDMARRLFAITHVDKFFDLREPSASRPKQATYIVVLGRDLPKSRTAEEFAYAVDRAIAAHPEVNARRDSDGLLRWIYGERQCQVHCVSDTDIVVMRLQEQAKEPVGYWTVADVKKIAIAETSPWTAAHDIMQFLSGRAASAL